MDKPAQWALVAAAWFTAVCVAGIAFMAWRHFDRVAVQAAEAALPLGTVEALPLGATALCPVTKEKLLVAADTPQLVYRDLHYYFAKSGPGGEPKRLFLMDPELYLHPGLAQAPAPELPAPTPASSPLPGPAAAPRVTEAPQPTQAHTDSRGAMAASRSTLTVLPGPQETAVPGVTLFPTPRTYFQPTAQP
jgi:hypothetical protein